MYEIYIEKIKCEIQRGDYDKSSELFIQLIHKLMENNDNRIGEAYYEYGMFLFDLCEYELSVHMLKSAYELNFETKLIKDFLYSCFIEPNREEFELNFKNALINKRSSIFLDYIPSIEELILDFIPLSENKYMIFNRENCEFNGVIDISDENDKTTEEYFYEDEYSDLVVIDNGMLQEIWKHFEWASDRTIYCITKNAAKMLSFSKLSGMIEKYLHKIYIFDSLNQLELFLYRNVSVYIPKIVDAVDRRLETSFYEMVRRLHEKRIHSFKGVRENILLSICIPTFNRGHRALQCVEQIMKLPYDSEIEVIVSNNGSTKYIEEYRKIKEIADARLIYFEFEENRGFTANLYNAITIANGKYSLVMSDEDVLLPLSLPYYLKTLSKIDGMSFGSASTVCVYRHEEDLVLKKGMDAFSTAFVHSNISGLIYNNELFQNNKMIEETVKDLRNEAVIYYPHLCWNLILNICGDYYQWKKILLQEGKEEKTLAVEKDGTLPKEDKLLPYYTSIESRILQHDGFIHILNNMNLKSKDNVVFCYSKLFYRLIHLMISLYGVYGENELGIGRQEWEDKIFSHCIKKIDSLNLESFLEDAIVLLMQNIRKEFTNEIGGKTNL